MNIFKEYWEYTKKKEILDITDSYFFNYLWLFSYTFRGHSCGPIHLHYFLIKQSK